MRSRNKTDTTWSTPRTSSTSCTSPCPVDKQRHLTNKPTESNETPRGTRIFGSHLMTSYIIWEMTLISPSWNEFQKIDWICKQDSHSQTHICAVQFFPKRGTLSTRLTQVIRIAVSSLCFWKESVVWYYTWMEVTSPAAYHEHITFLIHSSFYLQNTQHNRHKMINSKNIQYVTNISKLSQSTSSVIQPNSSHSLTFSFWSISFHIEQNRWTQERVTKNPVDSCQAKHQ